VLSKFKSSRVVDAPCRLRLLTMQYNAIERLEENFVKVVIGVKDWV
jgi:hypothetical protein